MPDLHQPMPDLHQPSLSDARMSIQWPTGNGSIFNTKVPPPASGHVGLGPGRIQPTWDAADSTIVAHAAAPTGMFDAFVKTCQRWRLEERWHAILLGYKDNEFLGQQLLHGYMPPRTRDVRDRIGYVLTISLGLGALFSEDADAEFSWLTKEHPVLKTSPLQFMLRGRMINLITVADIVRAERAL
jgi:hypothetical protein